MAKTKPQDTPQAAEAPARPPWMDDEFAGHGGSYEIDPATGKRRLVERTAPPDEVKAKED